MPPRAPRFERRKKNSALAAILEPYNNDLMRTPERMHSSRNLLIERKPATPCGRTLGFQCQARASSPSGFHPRAVAAPISGPRFSLRQNAEDDPVDQEVTAVFLPNIIYVWAALGLWGRRGIWRSKPAARPAVVLMALVSCHAPYNLS